MAAQKPPPTWPIFRLPLDIRKGAALPVLEVCSSATGAVVRAAELRGTGVIGILMQDGRVDRVGGPTERLPFGITGILKSNTVVVTW